MRLLAAGDARHCAHIARGELKKILFLDGFLIFLLTKLKIHFSLRKLM